MNNFVVGLGVATGIGAAFGKATIDPLAIVVLIFMILYVYV